MCSFNQITWIEAQSCISFIRECLLWARLLAWCTYQDSRPTCLHQAWCRLLEWLRARFLQVPFLVRWCLDKCLSRYCAFVSLKSCLFWLCESDFPSVLTGFRKSTQSYPLPHQPARGDERTHALHALQPVSVTPLSAISVSKRSAYVCLLTNVSGYLKLERNLLCL